MLPEPLPCPECRMHGNQGVARIGNNRRFCTLCNRFSAAVRRRAGAALIAAHPDEYADMRVRLERDLYPRTVEQWISAHPETDREDDL